jgi:hypothetical protein
MKTLEEAWKWYRDAKSQLELERRMASHCWPELPWEGTLDRDDRFDTLVREGLEQDAEYTLAKMDDSAVVLLFAVFESLVWHLLAAEIQREVAGKSVNHAVLLQAVDDLINQVEDGSLFRVLGPFKTYVHNLVEKVNQVRQYRNWVAHGRRGKKPQAVGPKMAYEQLTEFWNVLATRSADF